MYRSNRRSGDYRPERKRSRSRSRPRGSQGNGLSRYGPPSRGGGGDGRTRDRRSHPRRMNTRPDRSRGRANYGRYPANRSRSRRNDRTNRRSRSRHRERSQTHCHSRRMRGGRSASTDRGHACRSDSPKKKDLSDDSASHDDTIGSYDGVRGDVIDNRYEIIGDGGIGTFGRVVLCVDMKHTDKPIVALKVVRKVEKYSDSAKIEASILRNVNEKDENDKSLCVRMLRWFEFRGHVILVFERLGCSLYDYLKKHEYKPFPIESIRAYAWQLLTSLKYLHSINLIHTDLKPENILLIDDEEDTGERARLSTLKRKLVPPASDRVKLIDFGGATYDDESKSGIINTRQYRSPEVMLGVGWSFPSDIWSAACIIAELYLGELLFVTHENLEHMALIQKCIGAFPPDMVAKADRQATKYFSEDHKLKWPEMSSSQESLDHVRKMKALEEIIEDEPELLDLLTKMLAMDPAERLTAAQALEHPFFIGVSLETLHGTSA